MNLDRVAQRLFEGVMAPMVLGGTVTPGRAIGARAALALGHPRSDGRDDGGLLDPTLASRVAAARVRIARRLAPVDTIPAAQSSDWALAAALHDLLQSVHPGFATPFRRHAAARILEAARSTLERVPSPATTGEALSRHTWLARLLEVRRTDTSVSWWSGWQTFLGTDPPDRLRAWPRLRRVAVTTHQYPWLELEPIAIDRAKLSACVALLLAQTPLTDLSTCTRKDPTFAWTRSTLDLLAKDAGRALALRALARLDPEATDTVLGASLRGLLANGGPKAGPKTLTGVMNLLADRALAALEADERAPVALPAAAPSDDAVLARGIGAFAAKRQVAASDTPWSRAQRAPLLAALDAMIARTPKIERFVG